MLPEIHLHSRPISVLLAVGVKFWTPSTRQRVLGKRAAVAVMLLLWGFILALAASPQLHEYVHKDAQTPGHHCLVTQLQRHALLTGFVAALAPEVRAAEVCWISSDVFQSVASFDYRLSPSRAPPSVFS